MRLICHLPSTLQLYLRIFISIDVPRSPQGSSIAIFLEQMIIFIEEFKAELFFIDQCCDLAIFERADLHSKNIINPWNLKYNRSMEVKIQSYGEDDDF